MYFSVTAGVIDAGAELSLLMRTAWSLFELSVAVGTAHKLKFRLQYDTLPLVPERNPAVGRYIKLPVVGHS